MALKATNIFDIPHRNAPDNWSSIKEVIRMAPKNVGMYKLPPVLKRLGDTNLAIWMVYWSKKWHFLSQPILITEVIDKRTDTPVKKKKPIKLTLTQRALLRLLADPKSILYTDHSMNICFEKADRYFKPQTAETLEDLELVVWSGHYYYITDLGRSFL